MMSAQLELVILSRKPELPTGGMKFKRHEHLLDSEGLTKNTIEFCGKCKIQCLEAWPILMTKSQDSSEFFHLSLVSQTLWKRTTNSL